MTLLIVPFEKISGIIKMIIAIYEMIVVNMERKNWMTGCGIPSFFFLITASSSALGGISGVVLMLHQTDAIEHTAPTKNDAKTQFGILPV
jgi:hypothetical protein